MAILGTKADHYSDKFWFSNSDQWSNLFGRRAACKDQGLSGKALRDCKKGLRQDDKGLSFAEKRERAIDRKIGVVEAPMGEADQAIDPVTGAPIPRETDANIIAAQNEQRNRMAADMAREERGRRTGMYIAVGAGSLLLLGLLVWFFKFRGKGAK